MQIKVSILCRFQFVNYEKLVLVVFVLFINVRLDGHSLTKLHLYAIGNVRRGGHTLVAQNLYVIGIVRWGEQNIFQA